LEAGALHLEFGIKEILRNGNARLPYLLSTISANIRKRNGTRVVSLMPKVSSRRIQEGRLVNSYEINKSSRERL